MPRETPEYIGRSNEVVEEDSVDFITNKKCRKIVVTVDTSEASHDSADMRKRMLAKGMQVR